MRKQSRKRRKRKSNNLFGLLLLEALAVAAVLSLVSFSQSARSGQAVPSQHYERPANTDSVTYRPMDQEKTLPKLATWRYNTGPNSEYAYPESFHGSRPHSR